MAIDAHVRKEDTPIRKVSPKCSIKLKKKIDAPRGMSDTCPKSVGERHVSDTDTATNLKCPCFIVFTSSKYNFSG